MDLCLLGRFRLLIDGQELDTLTRARSVSLLACLSIAPGGMLDRNWLAAMFWPASTHEQARTNLRRELHELRRLHPLIDACIRTNKAQVQWVDPASCRIDVREFEAMLARADGDARDEDNGITEAHGNAGAEVDSGARALALRAAFDRYHGELLPGLNDTWVLARREALSRKYREAAYALASHLETAGRLDASAEIFERLLAADRLDEKVCERLMRLYLDAGHATMALRAYRATARAIEQDLGMAPGAELIALQRQALSGSETNPRNALPLAAPPGLVGRQQEWNRLTSLWRRAMTGRAQFCLVQGASGIGKTCLVEAFAESVRACGLTMAQARTWDAASLPAFSPLAVWLGSASLRERRRRLDTRDRAMVDAAMPSLVNKDDPAELGADSRATNPQRGRLFENIASMLAPSDEPTLLVLDDMQWCDGDSFDALSHLLDGHSDSPLLVLATLRDEEAHDDAPIHAFLNSLRRLDVLHRIALDELGLDDTAALFALECRRLSRDPLPVAAIEAFHRRFGGSPLITVQWLQASAEGIGSFGMGDEDPIPTAIAEIIATRIERLSADALETAQIAAVAGNRVSLPVLADVAGLSASDAGLRLDRLWQARLMRDPEPGIYEFEHDAIRELLYQRLPPSRRGHWHRAIAVAMIAIDGPEADVNGLRIAFHFEQAGDRPAALDWALRAAEAAEQRRGYGVAIQALEAALRLLDAEPPSARVIENRSRFLLGIVNNATIAYGTSGAEIASALGRLGDLADQIQDPLLKVQVWNRVRLHEMDHDLTRARDTAKHVAALCAQTPVPVLRVEAHRAIAAIHLLAGEFDMARQQADAALEIHQAAIEAGTADAAAPPWPALGAIGVGALAAWIRGQAEIAASMLEALSRFSLLHLRPTDRAPILAIAAELDVQWRRVPMLRRRVAALERANETPDHPLAVGVTNLYRGRLAVLSGQAAAGVGLLEQAQRLLVNGRAGPTFETRCLLGLVEGLIACGHFERAVRAIDRGQAAGAARGEFWWAAEFHRLRASCLARTEAADGRVIAELAAAKSVAREQQAVTFLMRALVDEAAYHLQRGGRAELNELDAVAGMNGQGLAPPERLAWQRIRRQLAARSMSVHRPQETSK
ncbi:MAG: AAA family ATPase [Burkholderiaceae bacterium]